MTSPDGGDFPCCAPAVEGRVATPACRHCGDPIALANGGDWTHDYGDRRYFSCQRGVVYGHLAAHPEAPCVPGGPNPCRCTYA